VISGFSHAVVEYCALLGYYAASSGNLLTTTRCVIIQKSAVLILDNVQCPSDVDVINCTYSVEHNTSLFKFELRLYMYATQEDGLASIKILYICVCVCVCMRERFIYEDPAQFVPGIKMYMDFTSQVDG